MKQLAILLILYFISSSFVTEQEQHPGHPIKLANTTWKVNGKCLESEDQSSFSITSYVETKDISSRWGHFISFTEKTFSTHYSAPCGNDCFTSVSGTYEQIDNEILFYVKNISRSGFCSQESETPKKSYGLFKVTETKNGLTFTKISK
jgi:hypothetical protein